MFFNASLSSSWKLADELNMNNQKQYLEAIYAINFEIWNNIPGSSFFQLASHPHHRSYDLEATQRRGEVVGGRFFFIAT